MGVAQQRLATLVGEQEAGRLVAETLTLLPDQPEQQAVFVSTADTETSERWPRHFPSSPYQSVPPQGTKKGHHVGEETHIRGAHLPDLFKALVSLWIIHSPRFAFQLQSTGGNSGFPLQ
jgi:hypothetical protein